MVNVIYSISKQTLCNINNLLSTRSMGIKNQEHYKLCPYHEKLTVSGGMSLNLCFSSKTAGDSCLCLATSYPFLKTSSGKYVKRYFANFSTYFSRSGDLLKMKVAAFLWGFSTNKIQLTRGTAPPENVSHKQTLYKPNLAATRTKWDFQQVLSSGKNL